MLPEATLAKYVGACEMAPAMTMTITQEGTRLFGQLTGQPRTEMFAESATAFFVKVVDAQFDSLPTAAPLLILCFTRAAEMSKASASKLKT